MTGQLPTILIVYASLGTGHKSAAEALGTALERSSAARVQVVDVLDYMTPMVSKALDVYYTQASEHGPRVYKALYEASDKGDMDSSGGVNRLIGVIGSPFIKEFDDLVDRMAPDAIICTQQVPLHLLAERKKSGRLSLPIYVVITDFIAHSTWLASDVAGYFVPSEVTAEMLAKRGIAPEIITITGIPVGLEIAEEKTVSAMRARHRLPDDLPLVTCFGGGIDPERVRLIVSQLLGGDIPATLVVVAGRNERLDAALADLGSGKHVQLCTLGKIDYVDDLVAASDLVITKAGGLIVSEVLARGVPMVIIDPIPGQEEWNADLVAASGAGVQLRMAEMVPTAVEYLLGQMDLLMSMRRQAQKLGRPHAAHDVVAKVLEDLRTAA